MSAPETLAAVPTIQRHEGFRSKVYKDTTGHRTIGYGFNLDRPDAAETCARYDLDFPGFCLGSTEITPVQAASLLISDLDKVGQALSAAFPWWGSLTSARKTALLDMGYNLGIAGIKVFHGMLAAIGRADWDTAALCMRDSLWARQVQRRALEDAELMRHG